MIDIDQAHCANSQESKRDSLFMEKNDSRGPGPLTTDFERNLTATATTE